ncbi:hypothetical protein ACFSM5_05390 [Lacibacterium aquatile]|uniref:Lipoprotein n=1 Tax=Lacibacterium aquatile TaxID=1168082 RepID=A0ABW5DME5_9PROT
MRGIWAAMAAMAVLSACSAPDMSREPPPPPAAPAPAAMRGAPPPAAAAKPAPPRPASAPTRLEPPVPAVQSVPLAPPPASGAASAPPPAPSQMEAALPPPPPAPERKTGWLVGSFGGHRERGLLTEYRLTLCDDKEVEAARLAFRPPPTPRIISEGGIEEELFSGTAFAVPLPEGRYHFCDTAFTSGSDTVEMKRRFAVPVAVRPGMVNYVGRYIGVPVFGRNFVGMRALESAYWVVNDRRAADWPALQRLSPKTMTQPPIDAVPPDEALARPVFWPMIRP